MDARATLAPLLLAAGMAAQTVLVLPASHGSREGTTVTNVPFGRGTPVRCQLAYDASLFPGPGRIVQIGFRFDGGTTGPGKTVDCEIRMSTLARALVDLSADFAPNRGGDETVVLPRQSVPLAPGTAGTTPNPFEVQVPLAVPFAFDPARGGLLVEIVVFGQPPGAYPLDATFLCTSADLPFGPPACAQSGGNPLRVESLTPQVLWGRPWFARVLEAQPGALVTLVLGTRESGPWSGFVLPQDLAILGAPGCFLSTDLVASQLQVAAGDGTALFGFVLPNDPTLVGAWIRFQGGAVNLAANALGVVTSQARKVQVCGLEPVGRVWAAQLAATAGTREMGVAPVVQIRLQ